MTESLSSAGKKDQDRPARRGTGLVLLAVVLALASLCATGWLWWQNSSETQGEAMQFAAELSRQGQMLAKLDARSGALDSQLSALAAGDPGQRLGKLEQELGSLQATGKQWKSFQDETAAWTRSMQAVMESAQDRLAGAEARLAALSARNMDSSAELDLDEVDYVLRLAQERLALFADAQTADRALEIADRHIAAIDNPMYIGLRRELSSARQKLSLLNVPDYQALEQSLESLQSGLVSLPFKGEGVTFAQPETSDEPGWWARIRNAFSGLVTVRRSTGDDMESPVMADQELIRQRAWLELEVARLAVLRRDQEAYSAALNRLSGTLQRWFEPSAQGWQGAMDILRELKLLDIAPPMPDISAPWTALRALRGSGFSAPLQSEPIPQVGGEAEEAADSEAADDPQTKSASSGDAAR